MNEDSSDVSKAMAAFGVPKIRYHSFGQTTVRPAGMVQPRRVVSRVGRPAGPAAEPDTRQEEPEAAPEPSPALVSAPDPVPPVAVPEPVPEPAAMPWNASIYAGRLSAAVPPVKPAGRPPRTLPELFAFLAGMEA